jgi:hypothetical protein
MLITAGLAPYFLYAPSGMTVENVYGSPVASVFRSENTVSGSLAGFTPVPRKRWSLYVSISKKVCPGGLIWRKALLPCSGFAASNTTPWPSSPYEPSTYRRPL